MKKIYIAPLLVVEESDPITVIAFSNPDVTVDPDDEVDAGSVDVKSHINNNDLWQEGW